MVTRRVYLARLLRYSASTIIVSRPWPLGSRDVIGHVTIRLHMWDFLWVVDGEKASIWHSYWDIQRRIYRGHDLDLWDHVTSSVTWPFDSQCAVSYRWSVVTIHLSGTVNEIFSIEDIRVTTLTFCGHVTFRSRDHSTPHGVFSMGGQWWEGIYLAQLLRYSASKIWRSRPWPLGSRDVIGHVTIRLPMCGFL